MATGYLPALARPARTFTHPRWLTFKNGKVKAIGEDVDGEFEGEWKWWRKSGQPLQEGSFLMRKQCRRVKAQKLLSDII
jgi:antitoxin component YwqK of YwqJK toxin-antitoxin module